MFRIRSYALVAAIVVALPAVAEAQFAGVPRGPRRRPPEAAAASGKDSTRRDTIPPTKLPDMKAWVDSATIALGAGGGSGSGAPVPAPSAVPTGAPRRGAAADTTMHDGARAPDTATPLPSIALAGTLLVAAGLFLRRRAGASG